MIRSQQEYNSRNKFVRISNFNRVSGTPTDFSVDLSNDIDLNQCKDIWVQMVSLPHVFNNITEDNNVLYFEAVRMSPLEVISLSVIVPPGQYSATQLMTVLQNLLDPILVTAFGVGAMITFSLDPVTSKIGYTVTNFDTIQFFDLSTLAYPLGFSSTTPAVGTGSFPFIPSLAGPTMIFLHSQDIAMAGTTLSINRPISTFCSIPVKVNYLQTIYYESLGSVIDYINLRGSRNVANLNIKVRGSDGTVLEMGDNDELIIVLKVFY